MRKGEALAMCSKPLIAEGAWPGQNWGGEICGGFCGGILSLQAKGFPVLIKFGAFMGGGSDTLFLVPECKVTVKHLQ